MSNLDLLQEAHTPEQTGVGGGWLDIACNCATVCRNVQQFLSQQDVGKNSLVYSSGLEKVRTLVGMCATVVGAFVTLIQTQGIHPQPHRTVLRRVMHAPAIDCNA